MHEFKKLIMAKNKETQDHGIENFEQALTKTEQFIETHQKPISIAIGAIILVVVVYLIYTNIYLKPLEKEARGQMYVAEQYFQRDSFNLAIKGDGNYLGFEDIIDEYGPTKSANLAHYYAGISYLHLQQFDEAIDHLEEFDKEDDLVAQIAYGAMGDAYVEMDDISKGLAYYMKANEYTNNRFASPLYIMKAAQIHEQQENYNKALELYKTIQTDYNNSTEARGIEKYITRVKLKMEQ